MTPGAPRSRMKRWEIIHGDALETMGSMPAASVDAIVTSPPFADQRAYVEAARRRLMTDSPLFEEQAEDLDAGQVALDVGLERR